MGKAKHWKRVKFNTQSMQRDGFKCKMCGTDESLEVHHITNRNAMPNGGYVKENGITLCSEHHLLVEKTDNILTAESLYAMIGSSYGEAYRASLKSK